MDTSSKTGSVALFDGESLLGNQPIGKSKGNAPARPSASHFSADVAELLSETKTQIKDLKAITVTLGPGSFTGLRVGVVAAKTLAYALGCKVIGVNSLNVVAAAAIEGTSANSICAVMNAQRGQLFASRFERGQPWVPNPLTEVEIIEKNDLSDFADGDAITGSGLERLTDELPNLNVLDRQWWNCNAENVGRLSLPKIVAEEFDDHWTLKPKYYRASAAEEKRQSQSN